MGGSWRELFPALAELDDPAGLRVHRSLGEVEVPAGTVVLRQGEVCRNYLLVLAGSVKVIARAENGREMVLYRIRPGESCTLTTSCLFAGSRFPAEGVAETPVRALALPADVFNDGLASSEAFRRFVFATYSQRLTDLIQRVEQVAFGRLDERLARHLLERSGADGTLRQTHQELAAELGTAREVVSRRLKELERDAVVRLGRGSVEVLDAAALERLIVPV